MDGSSLFQGQGAGGQIADLAGAPVPNGTGIGEAGLHSPLVADAAEELEGSALQLHQSLADNGLISTVTALDVHHLGG